MNMRFVMPIFTLFLAVQQCVALSSFARQKGFVYLDEVDASIQVSLRYATHENFVGVPVKGYKKQRAVMTKQAAEALKKVQQLIAKDGYELVVYDAYRPQRGVNHFMKWSVDSSQTKKKSYYPRVDKTKVFELGYVAERSGHSRGSTVDLTLIKKGCKVTPIKEVKRTLRDGFEMTILDDGTVDFGSHFDLFDIASHYQNDLIDEKFQNLRTYLKNIMDQCGFNNYAEEWWHFTLKNEPYPSTKDTSYFDFEIK